MLPTPRRLLRQVGLVLGVSLLIGAFLFHVWTGLDQLPDKWPQFLWNVYFTLVHAVIIVTSVQATISVLEACVPLRSRWSVALHVGTLSGVTVVAYGVATGLCKVLHPSFDIQWEVLIISITITFVVVIVWSTFRYMRLFYQKLRAAEAAEYEARLSALQAQINPHFLFNAFNSIAALIRTRPQEAETIVEDLSDLFRYALQASKDGTAATLGEEIEATRRYLSVEHARYRDRLTVEIDVPEPLLPASVPSMTLQPLVENAVTHGVGRTRKTCTVSVIAERTDDMLLLRVLDTGPGFDSTDLDEVLREGAGLANVQERLELFFREDAQMRILPQGVELQLPLHGKTESLAEPESGPDSAFKTAEGE